MIAPESQFGMLHRLQFLKHMATRYSRHGCLTQLPIGDTRKLRRAALLSGPNHADSFFFSSRELV